MITTRRTLNLGALTKTVSLFKPVRVHINYNWWFNLSQMSLTLARDLATANQVIQNGDASRR